MRFTASAALLPVCLLAVVLLAACSPPAEQGWPPEEAADAASESAPIGQTMDPAVIEQLAEAARPLLTDFSDETLAAAREFSAAQRSALAETNAACQAAQSGTLESFLDGEWSEGLFRWFENEQAIAPAHLKGICVWQELERRTSATLRVYDAAAVTWASLLAFDAERALRIHERELAAGPELGQDSYRLPSDPEQAVDGSCVWLDDLIVCLSASPAHTADWADFDAELIATLADGFRAASNDNAGQD